MIWFEKVVHSVSFSMARGKWRSKKLGLKVALQETRAQSDVARNLGSNRHCKKLGLKVALQETRAQSGDARN